MANTAWIALDMNDAIQYLYCFPLSIQLEHFFKI